MNKPLLNRDSSGVFKLPEDGLYHISPLGEFPIRVKNESGELEELIQIVDNESVEAQINRLNENIKKNPNFEVLSDYDHFSHDKDKSTEAAGWLYELVSKNNGLWGKIRWSDVGKAAVEGGRYRFISPVWTGQNIGGNKMRPTELIRIALTNDPNLKGLVPLSNRKDGNSENKNNNPPPQADNKGVNTMDYKAELLKLLGLPAEATDDQISAACSSAKENGKKQADLQNRFSKLLEKQVDSTLEKFKGVIKNRDVWKKQLTDNFDSALESLEGLNTENNPNPKQPLTNRADAGNPGERTVNTGDKESPEAQALEKQKADWILNRSQELLKNSDKKRGLNECWRQATTEAEAKPEFKKINQQ